MPTHSLQSSSNLLKEEEARHRVRTKATMVHQAPVVDLGSVGLEVVAGQEPFDIVRVKLHVVV